MDCERVRDEAIGGLPLSAGARWPDPVRRHLEGCGACRTELGDLGRIWAALGQLREAVPSEEVGVRLMRRVRRLRLREAVLTVSGWVPAVRAAAVGVGISLGFSLLVPYSFLVSLCREALRVSDLHAAPYLLAGIAYGVPLALGAWMLRRRVVNGTLIGGLEISVLFLVILAPYTVIQCREFAPPLQAAFLAGVGAGAVVSSLAGLGLPRFMPFRPR